jgi:hypothetical protein
LRSGRKQQPLTDTERDMVAAAIVEHIRLCNASGGLLLGWPYDPPGPF